MQMMATCAFGLEALVAGDLRHLGLNVQVRDARVYFEGGFKDLLNANMHLRCSDRIFLIIGSFSALSFDELFEGVKALPWEDYIQKNMAFHVKGKSARSKLFSVSDCQSITKKAIADRLMGKYNVSWLEETGPKVTVEVGILNDEVTLSLDSSGAGLNRRGYRTLSSVAPLRETLAAGLVKIARWNGKTTLCDPVCGTGTIAVEAAMIARNIPPGLLRDFEAETWPFMPKELPKMVREEAREGIREDRPSIIALDIDDKQLSLARYHAKRAGVEDCIHFQRADLKNFSSAKQGGSIIANPPYGDRMSDKEYARELYAVMGSVTRALNNWKCFVITSDTEFERYYGKKADKKRKLYNGPKQCTYYQYFK